MRDIDIQLHIERVDKMKRKRQNPIGDYLGASVGLGVAGSAVSSISNAPAGVQQGIQSFSSMLPTLGTIYGAGMILDATKKLIKRRK